MICCLALLGQQDPYADSLKAQLAVQKNDSAKVLTLISLGQHVENSNPELAKQYYSEALDMSKRVGYKTGELKYYANYTAVLNLQGKIDSSILLNIKALELAKQYGNDRYAAVSSYNLGNTYSQQGQNEKAIDYMLQGARYFEKLKDTLQMQIVYAGIGSVYRTQKMYERSRWFLMKTLDLAKYTGNPFDIAAVSNDLGILMTDLGQYDSAKNYLVVALAKFREANAPAMELRTLSNFGHLYLKTSSYDDAYQNANIVIDKARTLEQPKEEMLACLQKSLAALRKGWADSASLPAARGLELARAMGDTGRMVSFYEMQANLALWRHDVTGYDSLYKQYDALVEAMKAEEVRKNIQLADERYETTKKDQQLRLQQSLLRQGKLEKWLMAGGLMALVLIGYLLLRTARQKSKIQQQRITELEKEKQLLATQQLLRGQEEERTRFARDLHDGLGGMLSGIKLQLGAMKGNLIMSEDQARSFNQSLNKLDEAISEMRRVAHNMTPESLIKFGLEQALHDYCEGMSGYAGLQINVEIHGLENRFDPTMETVVYRIIQELVNNAVKHAKATEILVQCIRQGDLLNITVEDNGVGFDPSLVPQGSGLDNIRSRVGYLNGRMDIRSSPGNGCSVYIECSVV